MCSNLFSHLATAFAPAGADADFFAVEGCSAEAASFFGEEEREEGLSALAFFCVVEFSASVILTSALE
jgi:hypothetical protein